MVYVLRRFLGVPPGYLKTSQNCVIDVLRRFAGFLWIIDVSSLKTVKCVYLIITYIYICISQGE